MVELELNHRLLDCPDAWGNFIGFLKEKYDIREGLPHELIDEELCSISDGDCRFEYTHVEFELETDMVNFLLKWS